MSKLIKREALQAEDGTIGAKHTYDNGHVYLLMRDMLGVTAYSFQAHNVTHDWPNGQLNEIADAHEVGVHNGYPHERGMLYDCSACESKCYCGSLGGAVCVACAIQAEQDGTDRAIDQMREMY